MFKLFLIPNSINENSFDLPANIAKVIGHIRTFLVEEPKSARKLLKALDVNFPMQQCQYLELSEHTKPVQIKEYLELLKKEDVGIISEAGCPCVADPGSGLVLMAHEHNIEVIPLVGPSSILLSVMASGLNGQNFAFNGYLPKEAGARIEKIKFLQKRALQEAQAQIIMEPPYRNQDIFEDLLKTLDPKTLLCVAWDLTGSEQSIRTKNIHAWKEMKLQLPKKPALFIIN